MNDTNDTNNTSYMLSFYSNQKLLFLNPTLYALNGDARLFPAAAVPFPAVAASPAATI